MAAHALAYVCREHAAAANQNLGHVAVALAFYLFIYFKVHCSEPLFLYNWQQFHSSGIIWAQYLRYEDELKAV